MNLEEEVCIECPSCGEPFSILVSTDAGDLELFEDCAVCCRPAKIRIRCRPGVVIEVAATND